MTPEAQRIAIAEACGLKYQKGGTPTYGGPPVERRGWLNPRTKRFSYSPPEYLSDLNAMHEAEKVLTYEQWSVYVDHLIDCPTSEVDEDCSWRGYQSIHAAASQRAEAFLRTIGKWQE